MLNHTLPLGLVLAILFSHWVSDFVAQTDQMAKGKSTSNKWLVAHVAAYGAFMLIFMIVLTGHFPIVWLLLNVVLHGCTDYVTSRVTSRLWKAGEVHWFFVVIGFDQLIHSVTMFVTIPYFF